MHSWISRSTSPNSLLVQERFYRIHSAGGVFVVFAAEKTGIPILIARRNEYRQLYGDQKFPYDVWSFLSELDDMVVHRDHGTEMYPAQPDSSLVRLLSAFLGDGRFTCTLEGGFRPEGNWEPLALNKFGGVVALSRCRGSQGSVIVLPQIADKVGFLVELFRTVLPEIAPHLFPHIDRGKWAHQREYEQPQV